MSHFTATRNLVSLASARCLLWVILLEEHIKWDHWWNIPAKKRSNVAHDRLILFISLKNHIMSINAIPSELADNSGTQVYPPDVQISYGKISTWEPLHENKTKNSYPKVKEHQNNKRSRKIKSVDTTRERSDSKIKLEPELEDIQFYQNNKLKNIDTLSGGVFVSPNKIH